VDIRSQILQRLSATSTPGIEDTALVLLALRKTEADPSQLIHAQRPFGGWSEFPNVGPPSAFHTALALFALRAFPLTPKSSADLGFNWLSDLRGRESHWLWQWKFRLFDRQVQFDPKKSGWPWVPGTVSWVAPTALSILAYRLWNRDSPRLASANAMLLDRACPQGGWNAGNSVVFGVSLDPQPDFTAMALLALRDSIHAKGALVDRSLAYLAGRFTASRAPYSLAWASTALAAYDHPAYERLRTRLETAATLRIDKLPGRILALASLALEMPTYTFREPTQ
jgi:hypothetical protein